MSFRITLAEIEPSLRKAARASGLDWGLAEEAGKTARWLAAFELPGPELMLAHLQNLAGNDYSGYIPDCDLEPWQSSSGTLCPIIAGAALADRAHFMLGGRIERTTEGRTSSETLESTYLDAIESRLREGARERSEATP